MIRTFTFAALLPFTLSGTVSGMAHAQCPTAADLDTGIAITDTDGGVERLYSHAPNVVRSEFMFEPSEGSQTLLGKGIYWLEIVQVEGGEVNLDTRSTYSYPMAPDSLPVPTPGGTWTAKVAVLQNGGITTETHVSRFGDLTTLTINACSYEMIPVTIDYGSDDPDDTYQELLHYLPELGISLFAGSTDDNGEMELYTFVSIEAVK